MNGNHGGRVALEQGTVVERDKFKVAVYVDGKKLGTADDFNKKSAEQLASERAMSAMGILAPNGASPSPHVAHEAEEAEDEDRG